MDTKTLIERRTFNEDCTIGELYWQGVIYCFTLEDPIQPPGVKILGKTAIPEGEYELIMTYSPKFKRRLPLVLGVPGFDGIRIHSGNTAQDTAGCIIVGACRVGNNALGGSRVTLESLVEKIETAIKMGKVFLTIKNMR